MKIWYEMLSDLDPVSLYRGVKMFCAKHKEIFPNTNVPAHIREYALEGLYLSEVEAWELVKDTVNWWRSIPTSIKEKNPIPSKACLDWWNGLDDGKRKEFYYIAPEYIHLLKKSFFDDDLVMRAVKSIGWKEIYEGENIEATRAHFLKIYKGLLEAEKRKVLERVI